MVKLEKMFASASPFGSVPVEVSVITPLVMLYVPDAELPTPLSSPSAVTVLGFNGELGSKGPSGVVS
jgi:hypothetical protein